MSEPTATHRKILKEAKARFKRGMEYEAMARINGRADRRFRFGDARNSAQWDSAMHAKRLLEDKPALTINKVAQHNLQIINDAATSIQPCCMSSGGRASLTRLASPHSST